MARVPMIDPDDPDTDPVAVQALEELQSRHGATLNVHRALANHPVLMRKMFDMADTAYFSNGLDPVSRELAYFTSAVTNRCHY